VTVSVRDLVVEYPAGDYFVRPLDGFGLEVDAGQLVLLLGASGCGKTTLLSVLAGILRPTSGSVSVNGVDVPALNGAELRNYRRRVVGIVFQAFNLVPSLSALQNVEAPCRAAGVSRSDARRRATELLERVGLADRSHHLPHRLSGGQQQRVAIARALVNDPTVVLADEPTAHLDYVQVDEVLTLVRSLVSDGRTVIVSTHDERMVALADRVVELSARATATPVSPTHELEPGELLFEQGAPSDFVYMVEEGEVTLSRALIDGNEQFLAQIGPGRYFGEIGPTLGLRRSATARAATRTRLSVMTVAAFRERVQGATTRPGNS
jgi:putative ABC transport system ATP-binding protein